MATDQVDVHRKAHLLLNRNPGAGAWLTSLPNYPDTAPSPSSLFTTSLRRSLRVTIWDEDSICPLCGQNQDCWETTPSLACAEVDRVGRRPQHRPRLLLPSSNQGKAWPLTTARS